MRACDNVKALARPIIGRLWHCGLIVSMPEVMMSFVSLVIIVTPLVGEAVLS